MQFDYSKSFLLSKTFWINAAVIVGPLVIPALQDIISAHPAWSSSLVGVINVLNRLVTRTPVHVA